ncbi:MAG: aminotransferase class I/II-fold pyridoxal phosphate-dependent enzyme [Planctomycetota bacterium]
MSLWDDLREERKRQDLWRDLSDVQWRRGALIGIDGKSYVDFASNDSLGLGQNVAHIHAEGGAGASRLITGNHHAILEAEQKMAHWMGFESALFFPSGWQANVSLMGGVFIEGDRVASDALNHASIVDGLKLSRCQREILPHGSAEAALDASRRGAKAVVVESLFSVDGDFYPLKKLRDGLRNTHTLLIVDEAHAVGVHGEGGRGLMGPQEREEDLKIVTASKTLGAQGGFVLCSRRCREVLVNVCRGFIYSTGVSPLLATLVSSQIDRIRASATGADALLSMARDLHDRLSSMGLELLSHRGSHIITLDFANHDEGRALHRALLDKGLRTGFLRYPTVPKGRSRIRISLNIHHTPEQIKTLCGVIRG